VLAAFLVPEITVGKRLHNAGKFGNTNLHFRVRFETHVICHVLNFCMPCQGWTRAHTYFAIMGGFFDSEQPRKALKARRMLGLTADSHPEMFKLGPAPEDPSKEAAPENRRPQTWILITESEIRDKSKGDTLGKLVAVLQTTWFIAQYLGRWTAHQSRTQLEVMTLGYAVLDVVIYTLWWDKPLDIQEPIDVRRGRTIPVDVRQKALWGAGSDVIKDAVESSVRGTEKFAWFALLPVIGMLFGGVHCFAWWFPFPTKREALLWKFCALYCTVCPVALCAFELSAAAIWDCVGSPSEDIRFVVVFQAFGLFTIGYIVCRIILLVRTFTSAAGPAIYGATNWNFILSSCWMVCNEHYAIICGFSHIFYDLRTVLSAAYFSGAYVADLGLIFTAILEDTNESLIPGAPLAAIGAFMEFLPTIGSYCSCLCSGSPPYVHPSQVEVTN